MQYKSPLHQMALTTPTDFWNDSCSISEINYALPYGAVGATTNPVIVLDVLKREMPAFLPVIHDLAAANPHATEDDIAWLLIEKMAVDGAQLLMPIFKETDGQKGRLSIQVNSKFHRNTTQMVTQSLHFGNLTPNIQVKMPMTAAGIAAIEDVTYAGISVNATVCFSVPQAIAVAEAVERGLARREAEGLDTKTMHPVCTIMVGRVDDWLKEVAAKCNIIVDAVCLEMAGVAICKRVYSIYKEKGYRTQCLVAAFRNHHHWSEFIGGDISLTMPHIWIMRYNHSDITCENRIDNPVAPRILDSLMKHFPDFVKAYEPDGMTVNEFDSYGPTVKTLRSFHEGYDELVRIVRNVLIKY